MIELFDNTITILFFLLVLRLAQEIYTLAMLAGAHLGLRKCLTGVDIAHEVALAHHVAISRAIHTPVPARTVLGVASMDTVTGGASSTAAIHAAPCQTGVDTWVAGYACQYHG
jgi:hypothetical protein